jgi:hypothetical protein
LAFVPTLLPAAIAVNGATQDVALLVPAQQSKTAKGALSEFSNQVLL